MFFMLIVLRIVGDLVKNEGKGIVFCFFSVKSVVERGVQKDRNLVLPRK